jgi:hypothetical protein
MYININSGPIGKDIYRLMDDMGEDERADILRGMQEKVSEVFFKNLKQTLLKNSIINSETLSKVASKPVGYK